LPTSLQERDGQLFWFVILHYPDLLSPQNTQTGAIDDLHRSIGELDDSNADKIKDGKSIVEQLAKLKYELQHNRQIL
jgi:hypothetical protein